MARLFLCRCGSGSSERTNDSHLAVGETVTEGFTAVKAKENAIPHCCLGVVVLWLSLGGICNKLKANKHVSVVFCFAGGFFACFLV